MSDDEVESLLRSLRLIIEYDEIANQLRQGTKR